MAPNYAPDGHSPQPGDVLVGRYRIVALRDWGAMGAVYQAEDLRRNGWRVAVKMPHAILANDAASIEDLSREARVAMRLAHPSIVPLYSCEVADRLVFLVMEYIEGPTLREWLHKHGTMSPTKLADVFSPIAEALDYAHEQGVIHRDIKPSNIMLTAKDRPVLTDFGIAREIENTMTRLTGHVVSGTLPYMSPEQLRGRRPDAAQDVYSFAITMYECLTGKPPFHDGDLAWQIIHETPKAPIDGRSPLNKAILKGLAKKASSRPRNCRALLEKAKALQVVRSERTPRPSRLKPLLSAVKRGRRYRKVHRKRRKRLAAVSAAPARTDPEPDPASVELPSTDPLATLARRAPAGVLFLLAFLVVGGVYLLTQPFARDHVEKPDYVDRLAEEYPEEDFSDLYMPASREPETEPALPEIVPPPPPDPEPAPPPPPPTPPTPEPVVAVDTAEEPDTPAPPVLEDLPDWVHVSEEQLRAAENADVPVWFENGLGMRFVLIPAGTFFRESPGEGAVPRLQVGIQRPFYLQATEVTNGQFRQWRRAHHSSGVEGHDLDADDQPVVQVTWLEATQLAKNISAVDSREYRLPTEAEWEYACRAGAEGASPVALSRDDAGSRSNFSDQHDAIAPAHLAEDDGFAVTAPVASYPPSDWGLHDMLGNVAEWCHDRYGTLPVSDVVDPQGPDEGTTRVIRGGSWRSRLDRLSSAARERLRPGDKGFTIGFRLVAPLPPAPGDAEDG